MNPKKLFITVLSLIFTLILMASPSKLLSFPDEIPDSSRVGIVDTFYFSYEPYKVCRSGEWLYYTSNTGVRRFNIQDHRDELIYPHGRTLMWIKGNIGFTGEEYHYDTRNIYAFDIYTSSSLWTVTNRDWSFGFGVGPGAIYSAGGNRAGVKKVDMVSGSVLWDTPSIPRYCDDAVVDNIRGTVFGIAYWSSGIYGCGRIQRMDPTTESVLWVRNDFPEASQVVDIDSTSVWIRRGQPYRGTDPYVDRLAKWNLSDGSDEATYYDKPYSYIWHLGPEGSLIDGYPDEENHALVWNIERNELSKIDLSTADWTPFWELDSTSSGFPLEYSEFRPFIDGDFLYFKDRLRPTTVYKFRWYIPPLFIGEDKTVIPKYPYITAFPNPFNSSIRIEIVGANQRVCPNIDEGQTHWSVPTIEIYNINGKCVATIISEYKPKGNYTSTWDAIDMPSGVYFIRMQAGNQTIIKRALLIR